MNTVVIINKYDDLMERIGEDIKKSPYKTQFFLTLLNMKSGLFYKKIKEKRFTSTEIKKISKHLYPSENERYELEIISKLIDKSKEQIRNGQGEDFELILKKAKVVHGL